MDQETKKSALQSFLADGGLKSRKFVLALLCLILLSGFVGLAVHWAGIAGLYGEFVGGVLGVLSIYVTGNAYSRANTAKSVVGKLAEDDKHEEKPQPEKKPSPAKAPAEPLPED